MQFNDALYAGMSSKQVGNKLLRFHPQNLAAELSTAQPFETFTG
jgi:hypothetical protein